MKLTTARLKKLIREELNKINESQDIIDQLREYFEEVREGIQLDVKKRPWSGHDRSEESHAINFYLQPENLEKIASGVEIDLGKWHRLLSHWADGGIYNAGLPDMPGFKIMDDYVKSIGYQTQAAVAYKYK